MGGTSIQKILVVSGIVYLLVVGVLLVVEGGIYSPFRQSVGEPAAIAAAARPSHLRIPRLGVDAIIQTTEVTKAGNIGIPTNYSDVAWFNGSAVPGSVGNAVMVGHRDTRIFAPGVFRNLNTLMAGDDVFIIEDGTGKTLHFRVVDTKTYYENTDRLAEIVGSTDRSRLNLITCEGNWNQAVKRYDQRLVVFTELVDN